MPDPIERDIEAAEPQPRQSSVTPVNSTGAPTTNSPANSDDKSEKLGASKDKDMDKDHDENALLGMAKYIGGGCFGGDDVEEKGALGTGKPILIEFRDFVLGGNLIRMAVAFVLALSLNKMVDQFVASFITPVLGIIGAADFTSLAFYIRGSKFAYGDFFNAAISFIVICSVLFFCLILPVQRYGGRCVPSWIIRKCPYCFSDMPAIATRCAHCTSTIIPLVKPLKTPMRKKK